MPLTCADSNSCPAPQCSRAPTLALCFLVSIWTKIAQERAYVALEFLACSGEGRQPGLLKMPNWISTSRALYVPVAYRKDSVTRNSTAALPKGLRGALHGLGDPIGAMVATAPWRQKPPSPRLGRPNREEIVAPLNPFGGAAVEFRVTESLRYAAGTYSARDVEIQLGIFRRPGCPSSPEQARNSSAT